jgi:hypothetical protein
MSLYELGKLASRYDTLIAHAMLHAVAIAIDQGKTELYLAHGDNACT